MPSLKLAAVAATLFSLSIAAPTTKRDSTVQGFKVAQVSNPNYTGRDINAALARVARKYGFSRTATSSNSARATPGGNDTTAPADPVGSGNTILEYLTPVTIGDQTFNIDFDTGSSDLWVAGQGTSGAVTIYKPAGSANAGESWSIQYGDQSTASGNVYTDSVTIGGFTVKNQAVEVAEDASAGILQNGTDGLLGLAFSSINQVKPKPVPTWFDNAVSQGLPNVFAADLSSSGPGSYDFGWVDDSAFTGEIAYTPVQNDEGFWMFQPEDGGEAGIADTGTTLILLSDEGLSDYYGNIDIKFNEETSYYYYPCTDTLPDFSLTVAGYKVTVPGSALLYTTLSETECVAGVQSNAGQSFAIYGDILLKTQYVVFDQRNGSPQLGFAAKAGS